MKKIFLIIFAIGFLYSFENIKTKDTDDQKKFTLLSPVIKNGEEIPKKYTCFGVEKGEHHISPPLVWFNPPQGTKYYALFLEDLDSKTKPDPVHWIIMNIPKEPTQRIPQEIKKLLPEDIKSIQMLPENVSIYAMSQANELKNNYVSPAVNLYKTYKNSYYGPCPEKGAKHKYNFRLIALSEKIETNVMLDYLATNALKDEGKSNITTDEINKKRSTIILTSMRFKINMDPDPNDPNKLAPPEEREHIIGETTLTFTYTNPAK